MGSEAGLSADAQITFLYTRDLTATSTFYERVLGLPLVVDQGDCRIYRVTDESYVGFCQRQEAPEEPQGVILTLVTDEVDLWAQRLRERGVELEKAPAANPRYGIYHCFLRDPNGYLIEIQRFDDPEWSGPVGED